MSGEVAVSTVPTEDLSPTEKSVNSTDTLPNDMEDDGETEEPEEDVEPEEGRGPNRMKFKRKHQGVIIEGKREIKSVKRLDLGKSPEPMKFEKGQGVKLGEIFQVSSCIGRMKADDLRPLHKVLFNRPGTKTTLKKNIRLFDGFAFEEDSEPYNKKREMLKRLTKSGLKNMCTILDLESKGTSDEKVDRILTFLLNPKEKERPLPKKRKKAGSKSREIVIDSSSDDEDGHNDRDLAPLAVDDLDSPSGEDGGRDRDRFEGVDCDGNASKSKRPEWSFPTKRSAPAPGKLAATTKKADSSSSKMTSSKSTGSDVDDSSDDEPLIRLLKKPPTDDQLRETIHKLLRSANLEEVTMKQIYKKVFETYPDYDLSNRKPFIKQSVKKFLELRASSPEGWVGEEDLGPLGSAGEDLPPVEGNVLPDITMNGISKETEEFLYQTSQGRRDVYAGFLLKKLVPFETFLHWVHKVNYDGSRGRMALPGNLRRQIHLMVKKRFTDLSKKEVKMVKTHINVILRQQILKEDLSSTW